MQLLTKGLDSAAVREQIVCRVLRERIHPAAILERPDPTYSRIGGNVGAVAGAVVCRQIRQAAHDGNAVSVEWADVSLRCEFGQKTGAFLDQHANYNAAEEWAWMSLARREGAGCVHVSGRVCAAPGAGVEERDGDRCFARVAGGGGAKPRGESRQFPEADVDWVEGDAFEVLRDWASAREQFDTIVLDPPAFAKSRRAVEGAMRGYKELNLRAHADAEAGRTAGDVLVLASCVAGRL